MGSEVRYLLLFSCVVVPHNHKHRFCTYTTNIVTYAIEEKENIVIYEYIDDFVIR